jgi:hypothetical protein
MAEPEIDLVVAALTELIDDACDRDVDPTDPAFSAELCDALRARFDGISDDLLLRAAYAHAYRLGTLPRGYAGSVTQSGTA